MSKKLRFGFEKKLPPSKCPDCGCKLKDPVFDRMYVFPNDSSNGTCHFIECSCGVLLRWSFPNVWKRFHRLPLFNMTPGEIVNV